MMLAIAVLGGSEASSFEDLEKNYKEDLETAKTKLDHNPWVATELQADAAERLSEQEL